ncbi:MAG: CAP domain-containing protein [Steroidobacteraceae bacterium]|jgi:uncharacterized protein YkwD
MLSRWPHVSLWATWAAVAALAMTSTTRADALSAVQVLREGGCGGLMPAATPLHHNALLDQAAEQWAGGLAVAAAVQKGGYSADAAVGLRVSGPDLTMISALRRSSCASVMRHDLQDIGIYRRGPDSWLMLASRHTVPERSKTELATRALQLINEVRASGTRCGTRPFSAVAPVTLSAMLANVAFGHAEDMAQHDYFEHEDSMGRSPAQQVRAAGYQEKLVGENIAYGPKSIDEAVRGWLNSPDHCENIMDPRFAEMGIAYAPGQQDRRGLYWVQLLAAPRA